MFTISLHKASSTIVAGIIMLLTLTQIISTNLNLSSIEFGQNDALASIKSKVKNIVKNSINKNPIGEVKAEATSPVKRIYWRNKTTGQNIAWTMNDNLQLNQTGISNVPLDWTMAGIEDFNGDGIDDIFWRNNSGVNVIWNLNANGDRVSDTSFLTVGTEWGVGGITDFNGDSKPDVLWRNKNTGQNLIWYLNGGTVIGSLNLPTIPLDWTIGGLADFDGDNNPDIFWRNKITGQNVFWYNTNGTTMGQIYNVTTDWEVAGTNDFDGDSRANIVWRNKVTGQDLIWYMNNTTLLASKNLATIPTEWNLTMSSNNLQTIIPEPPVDLAKDFYYVSEAEVTSSKFPITIPDTSTFYQNWASNIGNTFANQIQTEILNKFDTACDWTTVACYGNQLVGTQNASKALGWFIWGIVKGELNQIGDLLNINLVDLFNQIKDLVSNYKVIFAQILDLIKNPTVLLRLAVGKLEAFHQSEFFNKFYILGVFIAGFTGGAVIFGTVNKTFGGTKNILVGGRLAEQTNNIKNSVKRFNLAEELLIDAEKTGGMIGGTSGYKWIGLENDIWLPLKRGNVGGVSKVVAEGADINWHILTQNYNEVRFGKVVAGIEDVGLQNKVKNRRRCLGCSFVSLPNWFDKLIGNITVSALASCDLSRGESFHTAKKDLGVPVSQQPSKTYSEPYLDANKNRIIKDGKTLESNVYEYKKQNNQKVYIQDHYKGHDYGGVGDQDPHFNVRPEDPSNPGKPKSTGNLPGSQDHYYYKK
jgi:hypothetical protein